jgi:hypothetical protein
MNKFQKRVKKSQDNLLSALVIGTGFGYLKEISEMFNTVFVVAKERPELKLKNVVFREGKASLDPLTDITTIFIDRDQVSTLEHLVGTLHKHHPLVHIEGNEVIEREFSRPFYDNGFRAIDQQGFYHTWKKTK